ncbi:hypothetical protein EW146_g860 [Bondarzewia mesenterica]|uniref:HIT domain-containing protein n=1 Tax=Bondarzewia mesenterica TaxID=1095465 RepID=A0A4S4M5K3_9AGAM|nr:hypothetical protein EW146_g860 [Bondarzewia mesenterica]
MTPLLFSTIEVTRQVFYHTSLSYAIVNLKPIVPGRKLKCYWSSILVLTILQYCIPLLSKDVLVCPIRPAQRLADLDTAELTSLITSVQNIGQVIERVYGADGLTIACQDGKAAGQTIPHVHFHLLPRKHKGDRFSINKDDVYPALERAEGEQPQDIAASNVPGGQEPLRVDADEDRVPRSMEEMEKEAKWLRSFFEEQAQLMQS